MTRAKQQHAGNKHTQCSWAIISDPIFVYKTSNLFIILTIPRFIQSQMQ